MNGNLQANHGSQANTGSAAEPIRCSRFANDVEQLFGEDLDLDPRFLEESWTFGMPVALDNLHRRRRERVERESQHRAFRELNTLAGLNLMSSLIAGPEPDQTTASSAGTPQDRTQAWTPQDWTPEHRAAQRWIPEGWLPAGVTTVDFPPAGFPSACVAAAEPAPEPVLFPDFSGREMTLARAHQLLGVSEDSSREQIRSAYRRMVGQCHPDRLQHATDAIRQRATQQLAASNQAYRLLCATLQQQAA